MIDETLHQSQKNLCIRIYAKIVCALVNRFIKIISQGKSLLIRETLHEHSMEEYLRKNSMCNSSKLSFSKKLIDNPNFAAAFNGKIDKAFMHFVAQKIWFEN